MSVVRAYFETILKAWADAHSPKLEVAFEGVAFTKPQTAPYLETYLLPATTMNVTTDGARTRELGIYQINVVTVDGKGSKQGDDIAAGIRTLFPIVPKVGVVSVEQTPHISNPLLNQDGRRVLPVSITYRYES